MSRTVTPTGSRRPEFRSLEERMWWARETAPMTQAELAAHLGISKRTVQNYEAGVGHPSEDRLLLWANACDVDFSWLAGDFYSSPSERSAVRRRVVSSNRVNSGSNRGCTASARHNVGPSRAVNCEPVAA